MTGPRLVLVVEDSADDREAIERALRASHPDLPVEFVADGAEGLARLRDESAPRPALVLLDLNMPGADGYTVLSRIRAEPAAAELTVVVFTSSTASSDIDRCYAAGADSYIYKPVDFTLFRTVLQGAVDYWLEQDRDDGEPEGPAPLG
ncbi:response regulator [Nocardia harenae]|uniref:response regulator n=1 Tax=Nocardia harenae TaxID=358707 RepID=UPI0008334551|nr:response regulator [Nocardia harenae]